VLDDQPVSAAPRNGDVALLADVAHATFEKLPRTPENLAKLRMSKKP